MTTHLKLVYLNYLSYSSLSLENKDEGKTSTVNVSDQPQVSCDRDLSDSSTVEISAQLDLLTEGSLSKPRQNVSESYRHRNFTEPLLYHSYRSNVNAYLK